MKRASSKKTSPVKKRPKTSARSPRRVKAVQLKKTSSHLEITFRLRRLRFTKKTTKRPARPVKKAAAKTKKASQARQTLSSAITFGLALLSMAGAIAVVYIYTAPLRQPTPSVSNTSPDPAAVLPTAEIPETPKGLAKSEPVKLTIPDINLDTTFITVGQNADKTLEVPKRYDVVGWYKLGPTPGEIGPAVIVGHHTSRTGRAIFYNLSKLQSGQLINVERADGTKVTFKVDKIEDFDQDNFPTEAVYGNIDYPGLRLITCGGKYSYTAARYSHNTVVYASQTES